MVNGRPGPTGPRITSGSEGRAIRFLENGAAASIGVNLRTSGSRMPATALPSRRRAALRCATALATAAICLGAAGTALLAPSVPSVMAVLMLSLIVPGVLAACNPRIALLVVRVHRGRDRRYLPLTPGRRRAIAELRRELAALPETRHPTGL